MATGIAETNVHFERAGTIVLPGFVENPDIKDDLDDLCSSSTAQSLRDQYYADIVVLLTDAHLDGAVGRAANISAPDSKAYCVSELVNSTMGGVDVDMTATHEIGHLLGARHQRQSTCNVSGFDALTWHHGFMVGPNNRTMMAQNTCPAPTRMQRWSSPDQEFMGFPTGNMTNNNAKKVKNRASKVCCFRPEPPAPGGSGSGYAFLVSISGPSEICNVQDYYPYQATITATPSIVYPLSYVWETSPLGVGNYTQVSTSSSWVLTDPSTLPGEWTTLRLTVTDAANHTVHSFFEIHRKTCPQREESSKERTFDPETREVAEEVFIVPNPAKDAISIKGLVSDSQVTIIDVNGRICRSFKSVRTDDTALEVDLKGMNSGVYIAYIQKPAQTSSVRIKFVKL